MPDFNPNKLNKDDLMFRDVIDIFKTIVEKSFEIQSVQLGGITDIDLGKMGVEQLPLLYLEPNGSVVNNYEKTYEFDVAILSSVYYQKHISYQNLDEKSQEALSTTLGVLNRAQKLTTTEHDMHFNVLNSTNRLMLLVIKEFVQNLVERSWVNETALLDMPVNLTPINTEYDNMLVGWAGGFTIRINNRNALCGSDLTTPNSPS